MAKIQKAEAFVIAIEAHENGNTKASAIISKAINDSLTRDKQKGTYANSVVINEKEGRLLRQI